MVSRLHAARTTPTVLPSVIIREFPKRNLHYNNAYRYLRRSFDHRWNDMKRRLFLFLSALFFKGAAGAAPRSRSTSYRTARKMLTLPRQKDSWEHFMLKGEHEGQFLWTGDGEAVERWNELFAGKDEVETVHATVEGKKEHFFLAYGASKLQAPVRHDRDDETVVVLTLNRLVRAVTEIRFCIDSAQADDLAFLALPPGEWGALEAEFGAPALAYRFMPLPETMAKFEMHARPHNQTA
jgi:hypothetical protein